jgi:hypothetical protein
VPYRVVQDGHLYGGPLVRQAITSGSGLSPPEPFDPAGAETVIIATTGSFVAWQRPGSRDLQLTGFGGQKSHTTQTATEAGDARVPTTRRAADKPRPDPLNRPSRVGEPWTP